MMFNRKKAMQQWLKQFSKHRAFDHGAIREMELHITDHIDDLMAEGQSEESAFRQAIAEFGEVPAMGEEEWLNRQPNRNFMGIIAFAVYGNYLKIALRSFTKRPFFTFLNALGLSIGMAGSLLIALYVFNELKHDHGFAHADRIYRVHIDSKTAGEVANYASVSGPLADVMRADYTQQELVTRFREVPGTMLKKPEADLNMKEDKVVGVDATFFQMFGFKLLQGNTETALNAPKSVVVTQKLATDIFGGGKVLGQSLFLDNEDEYIVTGVIEDMPINSFLRGYKLFISLSSFEDAKSLAWNNWNFPTFVKLKQGTDPQGLQQYLSTVTERYLIPWAMTFVPGLTIESARESARTTGNYMNFTAMKLTDIHLHSIDREGELNINSDIQNIYILSSIGFFLLVLAAVNFMNLSTAYSLKRAKEVGIRKTLGSNKQSLIRQFLTEAAVISFLSLLLALVFAGSILPYFNELAGTQLYLPFENPAFWLLLVASTLVLAIFSGSYPAFMMSDFQSIEVLKGRFNHVKGVNIRNMLVVFQFTISVFFIVGTAIVYEQLNFIQNKDLGYQKDQIMVIEDVNITPKNMTAFKEKLSQIAHVKSVSSSSFLPTPSKRNGITYFQEGSLESKDAVIIGQWRVDHNYIPTLGLEIVAGRNFSHDYLSDSGALLINESALAMFDWSVEEAIGARVTSDFHRPDKENMEYYTIIGIVKNFHFESLRNTIDGLSFSLSSDADKIMIKLSSEDFSTSIQEIKNVWNEFSNGQPYHYYFMNESFNNTYVADQKLGSIFVIFTTLSIIIACLGLFGLAAFNTERRSKEIGVRKVMGAKVSQITLQLSIDFLRLVGLAILLAFPLSWYIMGKWLEDFSYRVEMSLETFILSGVLAVIIAILTVGYQSIKAAVRNPVNSLRSE